MNDQTKARLARALQGRRRFVNGEMPIYDSIIGVSIFLLLCEFEVLGQAARLKDIYLEIGRSQGGIRRILRKLSADGWIEISRSDGDQRNRHVTPTPKLRRKFTDYLQTLNV